MTEIEARKRDHIKICIEKEVESQKSTLFDCVNLVSLGSETEEVDTSISLFNKKLNYPIIIAGMTGGVQESEKINKNLAKAAEELGLGFGVGSQRAMLEDPALINTYKVRDVAPNILLFGNIGASQLSEYSSEQIEQTVLGINADVLAVHLNEIQEHIQSEGSWKDYSEKLKNLCETISLPVIVKETGMGVSEKTASSLKDTGISGIDVGGAGGTSFARVELERNGGIPLNFDDPGIPTAQSIINTCKIFPELAIIATGGIRSGSDIIKALVLGATAVGIALPLLKPAMESSEAVVEKLNTIIQEFKTGLMKLGVSKISDLKNINFTLEGGLQK